MVTQEGLPVESGVLVSAAVLVLIGVVMSYSTTAPLALEHSVPPLFARHMVALLVGIGLATAATFVPLAVWHRIAVPLWLTSLGLLVVTALAGVEVNGAQRWLAIPGTDSRFQPGELAKYATLLAVASVIAERDGRRELSDRRALAAVTLLVPPVALLIAQPDLGNAILLSVLVGLLLVVAGAPLRKLVVPGLMGVALVVSFIALNPYSMRRVTSFIDPWRESSGAGFQLVQSFVAFGQGGLTGAGLGNGRQKLFYLPEAHTDFILSVVAEELGLLGVLAVLAAFSALLVAGLRVAARASDRFALLSAFGMTTLLTVPAAVNAAVVMGLLPTKGLTLPFLSYGRTSLIVSCLALGFVLSIARRNALQPRTIRGARRRAGGGGWR